MADIPRAILVAIDHEPLDSCMDVPRSDKRVELPDVPAQLTRTARSVAAKSREDRRRPPAGTRPPTRRNVRTSCRMMKSWKVDEMNLREVRQIRGALERIESGNYWHVRSVASRSAPRV